MIMLYEKSVRSIQTSFMNMRNPGHYHDTHTSSKGLKGNQATHQEVFKITWC